MLSCADGTFTPVIVLVVLLGDVSVETEELNMIYSFLSYLTFFHFQKPLVQA